MDLMSKCVSFLLKSTCGADFESRQHPRRADGACATGSRHAEFPAVAVAILVLSNHTCATMSIHNDLNTLGDLSHA